MKTTKYVAFALIMMSSAVFFQNCSPGDFSTASAQKVLSSTSTSAPTVTSGSTNSASILPSTSSSSSSGNSSVSASPPAIKVLASGNSITSSTGKVLNFVNLEGLSIGSTSITGTQSTLIVNLVNTPSGRTASVKVTVDTSGNFIRVAANSIQPYMCHDQNANICAQYPNATSGQMEGNCQSPILYNGAITGSVNNLTTAASANCPATSSASTPSSSGSASSGQAQCTIAYSGGGSMQTNSISQATCLAACQNNQALNPAEHLTCLYNNQIIGAGAATSSNSSCGGSLSAGAVVNTLADSSGQSEFNGLQCGQANSTAKQCRSCSAKWSYPRGSYIGAQIQCVCN